MFNSKTPDTNQPHWERSVLEKIALEGIKEQRRARRWNLFFKFLLLAYFLLLLFLMFRGNNPATPTFDALGQDVAKLDEGKVAMIRLSGTIAADEDANAESINRQLARAFVDENVKGVMILANSGGGSPVQSSIVYEKIRALKASRKIPVNVVMTDMCASGCYFIASAADTIYANASSIVGSIGVISPNYGVVDTMETLGIKRRTMTSGKFKAFLDPTKPEVDAEKAHMQHLLDKLHEQFITAVKTGRGDRLKADDELFSGLFWTGDEAMEKGLVDDLKTPTEAAQAIGNYRVVDMTPRDPVKNLLKGLSATAKTTATQTVRAIKTNADELILK